MYKLEFLIENPDYANINDYDYVEAEFVLENDELKFKPKQKNYYKTSLREISYPLLTLGKNKDGLLRDIDKQVRLHKLVNQVDGEDLKLIVDNLHKYPDKYSLIFKIVQTSPRWIKN